MRLWFWAVAGAALYASYKVGCNHGYKRACKAVGVAPEAVKVAEAAREASPDAIKAVGQ